MCPRNDSSDIICRSKLKRNFIGSAKVGGRVDGWVDGFKNRFLDLHIHTTSCFCFKNHVWVVFMYGTFFMYCAVQ